MKYSELPTLELETPVMVHSASMWNPGIVKSIDIERKRITCLITVQGGKEYLVVRNPSCVMVKKGE